jgi:hypothetical protein
MPPILDLIKGDLSPLKLTVHDHAKGRSTPNDPVATLS